MTKRIFTFSTAIAQGATPLEKRLQIAYADDNKQTLEITAMLFSTENNRNHAYFEVHDLIKWENKSESVLHNLDHDLSFSGGAYLGSAENKLTALWTVNNGGVLEVWCKYTTSDPLMIANKDKLTAPSIELMVDAADIIENDNGMYFKRIDWVGIGWLRGIVAGSGYARISEIKGYSHTHIDNTDDETQSQDMKKKQSIQNFDGQDQDNDVTTPNASEEQSTNTATPTTNDADQGGADDQVVADVESTEPANADQHKQDNKKVFSMDYVSLNDCVEVVESGKIGFVDAVSQTETGTKVTVETIDGEMLDFEFGGDDDADEVLKYCTMSKAFRYLVKLVRTKNVDNSAEQSMQQEFEADNKNIDKLFTSKFDKIQGRETRADGNGQSSSKVVKTTQDFTKSILDK